MSGYVSGQINKTVDVAASAVTGKSADQLRAEEASRIETINREQSAIAAAQAEKAGIKKNNEIVTEAGKRRGRAANILNRKMFDGSPLRRTLLGDD